MDVVAKEMREGLPWELIYADDLVLMANSEEELRDKISKWKMTMEAKGLKMNASKTKVMIGGENLKMEESDKACIKGIHNNDNLENGGLDIGNGLTLEKVDKFCYLGDMLNADGGVDSAVVARIRQAWMKFREMSSILTNKKLKGKVYVICVRSCLAYGGEIWAITKPN
ncbi:uncharacterized protein LOC135928678 [Gordionus sp. m RMFG-2023]|uniref:uncharacterized protein LOC135928678 n=1 Tax=Gordionus sp. m RMFG-2023 TaxID=3053472 RepID=UPI0031FD11C4